MKRCALFALILLLAYSACAAPGDRSAAKFAAWDAQETSNPTPADTVLFVGSSTFTFWYSMATAMAPFAGCNRGFGGSTMASVLAHTNHFMRYRSTRVVVYEGDNDLRQTNTTPALLLAQCKAFVAAMNTATTPREIYFLSVKPCPSRWLLFDKQSAANALLRAYALRTPRLHFIDIVPALLNDDQQPDPALYVADMVHCNEQGYARIAPLIIHALKTCDP